MTMRRYVVCMIALLMLASVPASAQEVLWQDQFDQGLRNWDIVVGTWIAVNMDGRQVLTQRDESGGRLIVSATDFWDDYRVEADVLSETPTAGPHLVFRLQTTQQFYFARLRVDHQTAEVYVNRNGEYTRLAVVPFVSEVNRWYRLGVTVVGDSITVDVDGEVIIELTDSTLSSGKIGFRTVNTVARFADVVVSSVK